MTALMRIAWRTVGAIVTRVCADIDAAHDRLAGLRRSGIDEISYERAHHYLTVVVDHEQRRLVWAAPGRDRPTLGGFFDALGPECCAQSTHVSADAAAWIGHVVTRHCPQAIRCADPFPVVAWATEALEDERRHAWNTARGSLNKRRAGRFITARHADSNTPATRSQEPRGPHREPASQARVGGPDRSEAASRAHLKSPCTCVVFLASGRGTSPEWLGRPARCGGQGAPGHLRLTSSTVGTPATIAGTPRDRRILPTRERQ